MKDSKMTTPKGVATVGDTVHVVVSGFTAFGNVWRRGQEIVLDESHIAGSLNRNGESWLDRELANPDGRVQLGCWPGGPTWMPGTVEHDLARDTARAAAWAEPNPEVRVVALRSLDEQFGRPGATSRTIGAGSSNARQVEEQRARAATQGRLVTRSMTLQAEGGS